MTRQKSLPSVRPPWRARLGGKPPGVSSEISFDHYENAVLVRRELARHNLSGGNLWLTMMFLFQDLNRMNDAWSTPKVALVRYRREGGRYLRDSHFNISNESQVRKIIASLALWFP